jgi:hypothetical protein
MSPAPMSRLNQGLWLSALAYALYLAFIFGAQLSACAGDVLGALVVTALAAVMMIFTWPLLVVALIVIRLVVSIDPLKTSHRRRGWLVATAPLLLAGALAGAYVAAHHAGIRCGAHNL